MPLSENKHCTCTLSNGNAVRGCFPMLATQMNGKPLVYLDSAATTQKPRSVIERMRDFEINEYATVHRASYTIGENSSTLYENTREKVASFIKAKSSKEIIFTSGATQSINLVAQSFGRKNLNQGDEVILSQMEHHANIIPWQMICDERGANLKIIPVDDNGDLILEEYEALLNEKTKIVSVTHTSNALGTINPVKLLAQKAHAVGAIMVVDGAQSAPHHKIDVQELECDFLAISGHKMYGPNGIGILYGKKEILETMPPYVTGGDMIRTVTFEKSTFAELPSKFEAGTPPITQVIGLGEAMAFLDNLGMDAIHKKEEELLQYGTHLLQEIPGLTIIGNAKKKAGIISFTMENAHPHDIVTIISGEGVAIRGGHHCAQPIMKRFSVPATARASLSFYNNKEDLDALAAALRKVERMFS